MTVRRLYGSGSLLVCAAGMLLFLVSQSREQEPGEYVNSIGIRMIRVPAGAFRMGNSQPTDPEALKQYVF